MCSDYDFKGDGKAFALSYGKLAEHVAEGSQILIGDGAIVLRVLSTDARARSLVYCPASLRACPRLRRGRAGGAARPRKRAVRTRAEVPRGEA